MKKVFAVILMVVMLVSALSVIAACDLGNDELTVYFYHTMGQNLQAVLDKHIAEFNKIYPDIEIVHSQEGGYPDVRDKVSQELMVGEGPQMAYCYPDHVALYNIGRQVVDLYDYMNSTEVIPAGSEFGNETEIKVGLTAEEEANFIDGYLAEGTQFVNTDEMLTLPFSKSTEVLYYNETFFTKNNLKVPTHWWCGESCPAGCDTSMEYVCAKIKEIDPKAKPLGYDSEANWFITMCEQLGTDYTSIVPKTSPLDPSKVTYYTFYNDKNVDFLERLNGWYQKGWVTTQTLYGSYTSGLFTTIDASKEKSYMSIGSSAGATHQRPAEVGGKYPFNVGIATIPQADQSRRKVISQGPSVCMLNTGSETQLMATWLFIKYLTTSVEFQTEFSMASGYMPVLENVADEELAKTNKAVAKYVDFIKNADGGDNIAALSAKVAIEQADAYYTSPAFVGSSTARDEMDILLAKVLGMKGEDIRAQIDSALKTALQTCESTNKTPQPNA